MFPQFKKFNNESGIVLFIVLMIAIVIMIFSVGILTQSSNEINYAQQQIDQIAADQLSKGVWWNAYASASATGAPVMPGGAIPANGRAYTMGMTSASAVNGITSYNVSASYTVF